MSGSSLSLDETAETRVSQLGVFLVGCFLGILCVLVVLTRLVMCSCVETRCSLYGLSVHQAYRYIRSFPTDAAYIRVLVSAPACCLVVSGRLNSVIQVILVM